MTYMRFVIYLNADAVGLKSGPGVKKLQEKCMTDPKMCVLEPSFVIYSQDMETLFVKGMHHRHLSIIYLNQNLYCKGKHSRTINLKTHVPVLMKNPETCLNSSVWDVKLFWGKEGF